MGVELYYADGRLSVPRLTESLEQFNSDSNCEHDVAELHDMATVPMAWLESAFPRLSLTEQDMMLRHKVIPYVWLPGCVIYGVATQDGLDWAKAQGLSVVGRIRIEDYRSLVRRKLGRSLMFEAITKLKRSLPWASASYRLSATQISAGVISAGLAAAALYFGGAAAFGFTFQVLTSLFFCLVVGLRCLCLMPLPQGRGVVAPLLSDEELPTYTVLVPLFRETSVLPQLIHALSCLDYPVQKLDIKIILEEEDKAMHRAIKSYQLPDYFDVLIVPVGKPQTKPRALNYALQFARGELLTIYDSEDIPQPNQLKLAAAQLSAGDENVACLQAALDFYNPNENWLTRQFTAEYAALFHVILPALAAYKVPLLLGGTSNHFRVHALQTAGGWDAYNVTEDADLGIRLARFGYQTGVLHSSTFEEANPEIWNWMKQRRRWLKGFLQCWLVHNRNPMILLKELGLYGFCVVQVMTLGIFLSCLMHPFFLIHTFWNLWPSRLETALQNPFGTVTICISILILFAGYGSGILLSARGLARTGIHRWGSVLICIPLYWLMMSVAAWLALWDFCVAPFHWHKTKHGLSRTLKTSGHHPISYP